MDAGWKDKVWKAAFCDGAAQDAISTLKFQSKTVPFSFRIDEEAKSEFTVLCERLNFAPEDVLRQLVDSFVGRIRLMEGAENGRMTPQQQERFAMEIKQDSQIARNIMRDQRNKGGD